MRIPKHINIYGQKITIQTEDIAPLGFNGLYSSKEKIIQIDKNLQGDELLQTLLHEVFHALWDRVGLNQTIVSTDVQELVVETFSQFIVESPFFDFKIQRKKSK